MGFLSSFLHSVVIFNCFEWNELVIYGVFWVQGINCSFIPRRQKLKDLTLIEATKCVCMPPNSCHSVNAKFIVSAF